MSITWTGTLGVSRCLRCGQPTDYKRYCAACWDIMKARKAAAEAAARRYVEKEEGQ